MQEMCRFVMTVKYAGSVKRVGLGASLAGLMLFFITGCGGTPSPFSVSCTTRSLSSGLIRASVTVTNATSAPGRAYVYGPAFNHIRHVYPAVLFPTFVTVKGGTGSSSYPGFVVARVRPNHPAHLIFRFARVNGASSIAVSNSATIPAGSGNPLSNSGCTVG